MSEGLLAVQRRKIIDKAKKSFGVYMRNKKYGISYGLNNEAVKRDWVTLGFHTYESVEGFIDDVLAVLGEAEKSLRFLDGKTLDQLEEEARKLHDELCWGNRKDIGVKFPRTPLTKEEYNAKAKAYHEEKWVKLSDLKRVFGDKQP